MIEAERQLLLHTAQVGWDHLCALISDIIIYLLVLSLSNMNICVIKTVRNDWVKDFFTPLCVIAGRVHLPAVRSTRVHECHMTHSCACSGKRLSVCHQSVLSPHSEPHSFLLLHESRAELPGCGRDEEDPGARSTNDAVCFLFTLKVTKTRFSSCCY